MECLIIGGGIHGVHLAARLIDEAGVPPEGLRIIDPGDHLLDRWRTCTSTTGMTHLRSPSVHHLGTSPDSLRRFAGRFRRRKSAFFSYPYQRPSLTLFNQHCDKIIKQFNLEKLHIRERVVKCSVNNKFAEVVLSSGERLESSKVILAIGSGDNPNWPEWTKSARSHVQHIFAPDFQGVPEGAENVIIVGGGISAAQVTLRLMREGRKVQLVSRHDFRRHQFDSDPGWLGPMFMTEFCRTGCHDLRRRQINGARHKGSVPPDIHAKITKAIRGKNIYWYKSEVESLKECDHTIMLKLKNGKRLQAEHLLLATGFTAQRPGGAMIDELASSAGLRLAPCGYPILDTALRWHPRIYASGPLAELELGPTARNIAGARSAGDRIVAAFRGKYREVSSN